MSDFVSHEKMEEIFKLCTQFDQLFEITKDMSIGSSIMDHLICNKRENLSAKDKELIEQTMNVKENAFEYEKKIQDFIKSDIEQKNQPMNEMNEMMRLVQEFFDPQNIYSGWNEKVVAANKSYQSSQPSLHRSGT
jgi:rhamnose utilization protein RhaD (predicted bifunctional aldolase and dehydrogenase)